MSISDIFPKHSLKVFISELYKNLEIFITSHRTKLKGGSLVIITKPEGSTSYLTLMSFCFCTKLPHKTLYFHVSVFQMFCNTLHIYVTLRLLDRCYAKKNCSLCVMTKLNRNITCSMLIDLEIAECTFAALAVQFLDKHDLCNHYTFHKVKSDCITEQMRAKRTKLCLNVLLRLFY